MKNSLKYWVSWLLPALLCAVWILAAEAGGKESYALPSPRQLLLVVYDFLTGTLELTPYSGQLPEHLGRSAFRVLKGFLLAGGLGITMGFLTGRLPFFRRMTDPLVQAVRAIPGIGFLPISIVWFGVGEKNTLFLITLAAFFPIYLNTQEGAASIPEDYLRSGRMLGARKASLFWHVILPAAVPQVFVGLRLGLGVAWAYLVLGEMTGVSKGIGAVMMNGRMLGNVELVMTGMIVIAAAGKLTDYLLLKVYELTYPGPKRTGIKG